MDIKEHSKLLESIYNTFEKFDYYTAEKCRRDIEENRKGNFVIKLANADGTPIKMRLSRFVKNHTNSNSVLRFFISTNFPTRSEKKLIARNF